MDVQHILNGMVHVTIPADSKEEAFVLAKSLDGSEEYEVRTEDGEIVLDVEKIEWDPEQIFLSHTEGEQKYFEVHGWKEI